MWDVSQVGSRWIEDQMGPLDNTCENKALQKCASSNKWKFNTNWKYTAHTAPQQNHLAGDVREVGGSVAIGGMDGWGETGRKGDGEQDKHDSASLPLKDVMKSQKIAQDQR